MASPSKISITRRIRAVGHAAERCGSSASMLVGTLLRLWCESEFPELPKSSLPYSKRLATEPQVSAFVTVLRELSLLEATYWLSSCYAIVADEEHRKRLAMFFTPTSLTDGLLDDLAQQGVDFSRQTFMDPACGGAAFLVPIALRMKSALTTRGVPPLRVLKHVEKHLCGRDLDKTLCELSKQFLYMALHREIQKAGYLPSFNIHAANSLSDLVGCIGTVDVVVCNPPYRKMTAAELEPLRHTFADVIEAQPNLYCLFIALCVRLLRTGGRAALVTPTSFLSGHYFGRLRKFLIRSADIEHIGMVSDRQGVFIDVEQETALTVLRRRAEEDRTQIQANISVVSATGQYTSVGKCSLPDAGAVWPIPRSIEDVALLIKANRSPFRFSDYGYRVRIGAFVWNRDKRPTFQCAREVKLSRCQTAVPLLWSADVSLEGQVNFDAADVKPDEHRFVNMGSRDHASVVTRPAVVLQRVTSNTQARRLVAAAVPQNIFSQYGGFVGENHLVILEATEGRTPVLTPEEMAQLLAVPVIDRYFRCISGATNVSAFELGQLALPEPRRVKKLLKAGVSMREAVHTAYGLTNS